MTTDERRAAIEAAIDFIELNHYGATLDVMEKFVLVRNYRQLWAVYPSGAIYPLTAQM